MKVIVTGAKGQLGSDLCKELNNFEVIPLNHGDIEITDMISVKETFNKYKPDVIINTAAYVRVDDCEDNPIKAFQVNAAGARNIAVVAQELEAKLVHISTDYVFGGNPSPFEKEPVPGLNREGLRGIFPDNNVIASSSDSRSNLTRSGYTEFDPPSPINIYGRSKLAGEDFVRHLCHKHFIVRGSGLFGTAGSSGKGGNFVETMLRLGKERAELRVVNDQVFSPTYTRDMASKIAQLLDTEYYGIFHITNIGTCSWYEFTSEIVELSGLQTKVIPITSDQYPQKARRPAYSVLDHFHLQLLGMDDLRSWQEALNDYLIDKNIKNGIL